MKQITKTIIWLTIFSIAMGYLETAVVVYLRKIYYPEGFKFPLIPIDHEIAVTEFFRELATIIMLISVGIFTGKTKLQRFAFFLYAFAIWDLFYYVFLKLLLGWPESLFTWDILFLIPVPWVGPVIAPCIVAVSIIIFTFIIVIREEKGLNVQMTFAKWLLLVSGSITVMISFMWDYIMYLTQKKNDSAMWTLSCKTEMFNEVRNYIPEHFNWGLFWVGEAMILFVIFSILKNKKNEIN
jgi:hypothetical protein